MWSKFISVILFSFSFSLSALAFNLEHSFQGFVSIGTKELYVDYLAPKKSMPTVILVNGLTYSTAQWSTMVEFLKAKGLGVLRYDMDGMGLTLLKYGFPNQQYSYTYQVKDLDDLLTILNIPQPYSLVGLSYGGGISAVYAARYPAKVKNIVLMSPYTEALEQQDALIKKQIAQTRLLFPMNTYSDDALYDYFLKQICYTTYPLVEPIVLENAYKLEAVFRLTQGIRKLKVIDEASRFPANSVHLIIAEKDQYIPQETLEKFWSALPAHVRNQKIYVTNSEHKIPEAQPQKAAEIIEKIMGLK